MMEKSKKENKSVPPEGTVAEKALNKKERRALKVQAKQVQNKVEKNDAIFSSHTASQEKFISKEKISSETNVNTSEKLGKTQSINRELTEKQQRKLKEEKRPDVKLDQKNDGEITGKKPVTADNKNHFINKQLTEKELRKLEWEKKLAEQKLAGDKQEKETLSKAELRVKRREQQETQRLAKADVKTVSTVNQNKTNASKNLEKKVEVKKLLINSETKKSTKTHKVQLVQHLYIEDGQKSLTKLIAIHKDVHPAFVRLGIQYMNKTVLGSNARCLALLVALKHLIDDIETPPKQEYLRYLEVVLQICTNFLQNCRPSAVSMTNALRHFKTHVRQINTKYSTNEKRAKLHDVIDTYINNDVWKAGDAISLKVNEKITNGDILLIYGCSSLIKKILVEAHKDGKMFEVIIVDGRPLLEGKEMMRRLIVAGIKCTYILTNALSYFMSPVTKVILGAHALLTNGYVMSRIGTSEVALIAQAYNKPVLVCCETYKFSERVQTDSFVYNEVGDPEEFSSLHTNELSPLKWRTVNKLTPLSLLYDVTPPELVTAVVTELAILPCTSVPVVLRINANETA